MFTVGFGPIVVAYYAFYKYICSYIEMHTIASGVRIKISYAGLSNIYLAIRLYLIIQYVFTDLLIVKTYRKRQ